MQTKFKIVETEEYYLAVSDEDIKKGDWVIFLDRKLLYNVEYNSQLFDYNNDTDCKKIVAHLPKNNAPELLYDVKIPSDENVNMQKVSRLPLLPEIIVEPRGFDEFQYTEQDLRKIAQAAFTVKPNNETLISDFEQWFRVRLKALNQPQTPTHFEADIEHLRNYDLQGHYTLTKPKLKTKLINAKETLVGNYLFE